MYIFDPPEVDFSFSQIKNFRYLKTGEELVVEPKIFRGNDLDRFEAFLTSIERQCLGAHIEYELVQTSQPLETVLFHYLTRRSKMGVR